MRIWSAPLFLGGLQELRDQRCTPPPLRGQPSPGVLLALPRVPAQAGAPEHGGPWCCSRHESRWTGEMGTE